MSDERHRCLCRLVDSLDLDDPNAEINKPGNSDLWAALHEENSRNAVLWAYLRTFLRGYNQEFPTGPEPLPLKEIEEAINDALAERLYFVHEALVKRHLRGEPPVGLGQLAEWRFPRNTWRWEAFKHELTHELFDSMCDLQLWTVTPISRSDNGGGSIARWEISAGSALIDFDAFVYRPKRLEQVKLFFSKFHGMISEEDHHLMLTL
jgi:hypothetical protein